MSGTGEPGIPSDRRSLLRTWLPRGGFVAGAVVLVWVSAIGASLTVLWLAVGLFAACTVVFVARQLRYGHAGDPVRLAQVGGLLMLAGVATFVAYPVTGADALPLVAATLARPRCGLGRRGGAPGARPGRRSPDPRHRARHGGAGPAPADRSRGRPRVHETVPRQQHRARAGRPRGRRAGRVRQCGVGMGPARPRWGDGSAARAVGALRRAHRRPRRRRGRAGRRPRAVVAGLGSHRGPRRRRPAPAPGARRRARTPTWRSSSSPSPFCLRRRRRCRPRRRGWTTPPPTCSWPWGTRTCRARGRTPTSPEPTTPRATSAAGRRPPTPSSRPPRATPSPGWSSWPAPEP